MNYIIRDAKKQDLELIAVCHMASFPNKFQTIMGKEWLIGLYEAFLNSEKGILCIAECDDKIVGLIAGGEYSVASDYFNKAIKKNAIKIFAKMFTSKVVIKTLTISVYYKVIALCKKRFVDKKNLGDKRLYSNLLSIGVMDDYRGTGIAKRLVDEFEKKSRNAGYRTMELVVFNDNTQARKFYEKCGWELMRQCGKSSRYKFDIEQSNEDKKNISG